MIEKEDYTDEEIEASINKDISNWKKRLNRKGPFYLYKHSLKDKNKAHWDKELSITVIDYVYQINSYAVIWNDGYKTKYGYFYDEMATRYGVETCCVLNGDTKFDLWNGSTINDEIFDRMLEVRKGTSQLTHFNLDDIKDLKI